MKIEKESLSVLIVDDEPNMATTIGLLLKRKYFAGYKVATDCTSARNELKSDSFDIITLDYQLPDGNGLELLGEINSRDQSPPVIMVTGQGDEQIATESFRLGASSYVVKDHRLASLLIDAVEHAISEIALRSAEKKIESQRDELQQYFNMAGILIAVTDDKGRISKINSKGCEILGHEKDCILGKNLAEFMAGELQDKFESDHLDNLSSIEEIEIINGSGARRTISWQSSLIKDDEDNITGVLHSGLDITARKQAEAKYKTMIDTTMVGFFLTDIDGKILEANDSYCNMAGYSREELIGMKITQLEAAMRPEEVASKIRSIHKEGYSRFETRHRRKDGAIIDLEVSVTSLKPLNQLFVFLRDVTERRKKRVELEKLVENKTLEIQRVKSELEQYTHSVSHEIRCPLSSAYTALEIVKPMILEPEKHWSQEDVEELIGIINRNIVKSLELADAMLGLAKAGQSPKTPKPVNVSDLVAEILDGKKKELKARKADLIVDEDLGEINASEIHIYQVFNNIIENALKYDDEERLRIEIHNPENKDHEHHYFIKDNGRGIQEEVLDGLFEPFNCANGSSGLGLSIVNKILQIYGGNIRAYNDNGACFDFTIHDLC